jgi:hypothetical protein
MLGPFEWALHNCTRHTDARLDALSIARVKFLTVPCDELRFVIKKVALAGSAVHEKLNDALGFWDMMRWRSSESFPWHQRSQGKTTDARAKCAEEIATGVRRGTHVSIKIKELVAVGQ